MAILPSHLGRSLTAVCGRISEDGDDAVATVAEIKARMGDPPPRATLLKWLSKLRQLGLIVKAGGDWRVTKEGWRAVNLFPDNDVENSAASPRRSK